MSKDKEPERPWYIGSLDWERKYSHTPSKDNDEKFFEIENRERINSNTHSNSSDFENSRSYKNDGYEKTDAKGGVSSYQNEQFWGIENYPDLGIKNTFIWISMLVWAGTSLGLHLTAKDPDITLFSIKFLLFLLVGFSVLSYLIGLLFFYIVFLLLPKSVSSTFEKFQFLIRNRKILYVFLSLITYGITNYLFDIYYDLR